MSERLPETQCWPPLAEYFLLNEEGDPVYEAKILPFGFLSWGFDESVPRLKLRCADPHAGRRIPDHESMLGVDLHDTINLVRQLREYDEANPGRCDLWVDPSLNLN